MTRICPVCKNEISRLGKGSKCKYCLTELVIVKLGGTNSTLLTKQEKDTIIKAIELFYTKLSIMHGRPMKPSFTAAAGMEHVLIYRTVVENGKFIADNELNINRADLFYKVVENFFIKDARNWFTKYSQSWTQMAFVMGKIYLASLDVVASNLRDEEVRKVAVSQYVVEDMF